MQTTNPLLLALGAATLLVSAVVASVAQDSGRSSSDVREQRGLLVLREALTQSQGFSLPVNRIYIESTAAEGLWTHDQRLAHSLIANVQQRFRDLALSPLNDRDQMVLLKQAWSLRAALVLWLARYNPQQALEFLRSTPAPQAIATGSNDADLEVALATVAARNDLKLASNLIHQNLATSDTGILAGAVDQIAARDGATGTRLASEMMDRLVNANFAADPKALASAFQLLSYFGHRAESQQSAGLEGSTVLPPSAISDSQMQAFVRALYGGAQLKMQSLALQPDFPGSLWQSVQYVLPQARSFVPPTLRSNIPYAPSAALVNDLNGSLQMGNVEHAVSVAGTAPLEFRMNAYETVAMRAYHAGDLDTVRTIVAHSDIPEVQRAEAYIHIAQSALAHGDQRAARVLLNDARSRLSLHIANVEELNTLAELAGAYAQFDTASAVEVLDNISALANEKIPSLASVDAFLDLHAFYNGEMVMSFGGGAVFLSRFEAALAVLAAKDADAALRIAAQVQRPEARVMALLTISRALLGVNGDSAAAPVVSSVFVN
jgi:hypothetical protein